MTDIERLIERAKSWDAYSDPQSTVYLVFDLFTSLETLRADHATLLASVSASGYGLVGVRDCTECRKPYPEWSVSSSMRCHECRLETLRAERDARLTPEHAAATMAYLKEECELQHARAEAAEQRVAALETALRDFGRHNSECAFVHHIGYADSDTFVEGDSWMPSGEPCNCGLDAALRASARAEPGGEETHE